MAIDSVKKMPNGYLIKRSYNMKDKMCVYAIRNVIDEKHYIGITSMTMKNRTVSHLSSLRGNRHTNGYLQKAYNKYGEQSFEIITLYKDANSIDSLQQMEAIYCELYNSHNEDYGYNLGAVGFLNKMSESTKEKMKARQSERWKNQSLRKQYSDRMKKSGGFSEYNKSELYKELRSKTARENYKKGVNPLIGLVYSKESIEKGRLKRIGMLSGNKNPASQPIIAYNPITQKEHLFSTVKECADYFGFNKSLIERRIKRVYKGMYYAPNRFFVGLNFKRV